MHCHTAENAVCICGICMAVLLLGALLLRGRRAAAIPCLLAAAAAVVTALLPNTIIHMCMMTDMRCHAVMKPAVIILSILTALLSAVSGILHLQERA